MLCDKNPYKEAVEHKAHQDSGIFGFFSPAQKICRANEYQQKSGYNKIAF